jgi:hypothetical protein
MAPASTSKPSAAFISEFIVFLCREIAVVDPPPYGHTLIRRRRRGSRAFVPTGRPCLLRPKCAPSLSGGNYVTTFDRGTIAQGQTFVKQECAICVDNIVDYLNLFFI